MMVLFIPWILLSLFVVALAFLTKRAYKVGFIIILLTVGLNCYFHVFSFGFGGLDSEPHGCLRVMTWNINCADSANTKDANSLVSYIIKQNADVVFLTEFNHETRTDIDSLISAHYPYKGNYPNWMIGGECYSRLEFISHKRVGGEEDGYLYRFDVDMCRRNVSLYCLHLQSNNLVNGETFYPDSIADKGGIMRYLENYKVASEIRREQAELIVRDLSNEPCIVMGDMNEVCGSPCIRVFENAGLRDSWWEGGFGYGATLHHPLPYRIDHVMYGVKKGSSCSKGSSGLKLMGIRKVPNKGLSDHDALVADFTLR